MEQLTQTITISPEAFAAMAADAAYVKPVDHEGKPAYAIHAADGRALAVAPSRELAFIVIRQNELEPADAH